MFRDSRWLSWLQQQLTGRPRVFQAAIITLAVVLLSTLTGSFVWFAFDITTGLPDKNAVRGLGDMAQATTIYDASDHPVFTIFKEQRHRGPARQDVAEPDQGGRLGRGSAVLRAQRRRLSSASRRRSLRNLEQGRRAEGGSTITQQLARQSFLSRDKTYRRKLKEVILAAHIEHDVLEERDPRAVPEQGVLRRRPLRRRGRVARLLRQARERARRSTRRRCSPA